MTLILEMLHLMITYISKYIKFKVKKFTKAIRNVFV